MDSTSEQVLDGCADAIAGWPALWTRLLAVHVPGPDGRCRGCPSALHAPPRHPCGIAVVAAGAARRYAAGFPPR